MKIERLIGIIFYLKVNINRREDSWFDGRR